MIVLKNISKKYEGKLVLSDLSLEISEHETLCILGVSGCGKSTLLKVMAGLELPDSGSFEIDEQKMLDTPAEKRGIVYMSQEPFLFPHMNVFENIAFGLRVRKWMNSEVEEKVNSLARRLGLTDELMKMPHQLSGGQKQRVNFGRSLIIEPRLILLDEPFGSLDSKTRAEMQQLFHNVRKEKKITALFVTHDIKEALIMGDRIARMDKGQLKVYPSSEAFLNSGDEDITQELSFWKRMWTCLSEI
jgi:putrescine transport system ATP-binding protein